MNQGILRFALKTLHLNRSRTSLCSRVSKTQLAWGSTRAACSKCRIENADWKICEQAYATILHSALCTFHFNLGSWQTSNALALQASLCGSVTRRLHQPS